MKLQITKPVWRVTCGLTASVMLLMSFQNCGKAGFDSSLDESLASTTTDANLEAKFGQRDAPKVASIPFAYDTLIDQITYNSCTGAALPQNPNFFTFRVGAYSKGGVRLRQGFLDYLRTNFQPIYPETVITINQEKEYLSSSPENVGAQPQFAVRSRSDSQAVIVPNGAQPSAGIDFVNILGDLTNDRFMDPLVKNGTSQNRFFPFAMEVSDRIVEASINYNSDEFLAKRLRDSFRNSSQLAMTYTTTLGDPHAARVPAASTDPQHAKVFGRGYNLTFSVDVANFTKIVSGNSNAISRASNLTNILTAVQEVNLENPAVSAGATWVCDPNRRYVIVRPSDTVAPYNLCPRENISTLTGASATAYRKELEIVRRHLPSDAWDVNITLRCVVPKANQGSCYPSEVLNGQTVQIEYDQTKECFSNAKDPENAASPATKRCAEYVSICTRESSN